MDAYHGGIAPAHYYQQSSWNRHEEELWDGLNSTPQALPFRNDINPLQRYLHASDQPWFTPRSYEETSLDWNYQPGYANPAPHWSHEAVQYPHPAPPRCTSPSLSGLSPPSTYNSLSDRRSISWSPPSTPQYSPEFSHHDSLGVPFGGYSGVKEEQPCVETPCIALTEIQTYADALPEEDTFEAEPMSYFAHNVQEGYQPMSMDREHTNGTFHSEDSTSREVRVRRPDAPNFRRRHASDSRSTTSPSSSKVKKRPSTRKRTQTQSIKPDPEEECNGHHNIPSNRAFPCPFALYGCTSSFGSKNEWKRHINTQHMRLTFWRCDLCDQTSRKPNDFNRKDLFIQHVRRMHPPPKPSSSGTASTTTKTTKKSSLSTRPSKHDPYEQELIAIAHRCFNNTRPSPEQTSCLFCEDKFAGPGSWDDRLEHIGKHMEIAKKGNEGFEASAFVPAELNPRYWLHDAELEEWLLEEGIIVDYGKGPELAEDARA